MPILLYYSYISEADHATLGTLLTHEPFPPARRERLMAIRVPRARAEGIALTALAAEVIARWPEDSENLPPSFSCDKGVCFRTVPAASLARLPGEWPVGEHGKPFPQGIATRGGRVHLGLSHSGGAVLVAAATMPLGVDIQQAVSLSPDRWRRLDERIRHPDEEPARDEETFLRRWTAKEATVKRSGEGLICPLHTLCVAGDRVRTAGGEELCLWWHSMDTAVIAVAYDPPADAEGGKVIIPGG